MKKIKSIIKNEEGQGLIEALIALVIIGVVMIGVTLVTVKSLKIARKNEVQDVATQAMVEAMDYLKAPGDITAYVNISPISTSPNNNISSNLQFSQSGGFFRLDDDATNGYKLIAVSQNPNTFLNGSSCDKNSIYALKSLQDNDNRKNYTVCIQVYIYPRGSTANAGYDIYVVAVWQAPDELKLNKIKGFRSNEIKVTSDVTSNTYVIPSCVSKSTCVSQWEDLNKNL